MSFTDDLEKLLALGKAAAGEVASANRRTDMTGPSLVFKCLCGLVREIDLRESTPDDAVRTVTSHILHCAEASSRG